MPDERRQSRTAAAVIAAAAVLAALTARRYAVGLVNDDAEYAIAARALAGGGRFVAALFDNRLLRERLPGLPLLLAPLAAFARPPFEALKLAPWLSTLASLWLAWTLLDGRLAPRRRLAALALYAFNPLVLEYAGRVMSEPVFTAAVLASFWLARRILAKEDLRLELALGLLSGWAAITRGEGVALIAALALGFWVERRRRALAVSGGAAAAIVGAIALGNYLARRTPTFYVGVWSAALPRLGPGYWLPHAARLLRQFAWNAALGAPHFPDAPAAAAAATLLGLGWLVVIAAGLRRLERDGRGRGLPTAMTAFMVLYAAIHVFWPVADPRFFLPLLPLALLAAAAGFPTPTGAWRPLVGLGVAGWLLACAKADAQALAAARRAPERAPLATLAWISERTPESARFWALYDSPLVELYTGRPARLATMPADEDAFRYELQKEGVSYVLYAPLREAFAPVPGIESIADRWKKSRSWAQASPAFTPVYENAAEGTRIFRLNRSDRFQAAYELYLQAQDSVRAARWDETLALLDRALSLEPSLPGALNAYGATCLITGRHLALAERRLREALRLRPGYVTARENLARVERARRAR